MGAGEYGGSGGGEGGIAALIGGKVRTAGSEGTAEETFAREAREKRLAEGEQIVEVGEERVIVIEGFAEAIAGIEDDTGHLDAGVMSGAESGGQTLPHQGHNFRLVKAWLRAPFVRAAACVHEDDTAAEIRAGLGHGGIPGKAADIVDDVGSGEDGGTGGSRLICIHGDYRLGTFAEEGFEDGEDTVLFLLSCEGLRAGPRGFAADVDEVRARVEHGESLAEGRVGGEEEAAVGE